VTAADTGRDATSGRALVVRGLTDPRSMRDVIWPAYQADTGAGLVLDYRQDVDMEHLRAAVTEAEPGSRPDALIVADPRAFTDDELLVPVDGIDPRPLPDSWADPSGRWWPLYVQPIVFVFNSHYRVPPTRWTDLVDETWHDQLVFEAAFRMLTTGPALAELRPSMGDAAWDAWLVELGRGRPRQVGDNERAVLEVATGSRPGGLSNWNVARRVRPGSPARHVFLDPTPCIPGFGVVVEGGASPADAAALIRWLASPSGQAAYGRTGRIAAVVPDGGSPSIGSVLPPAVEPLVGTVDWVSDPEPWVEIYRRRLPPDGVTSAGKLRPS
jgi:ABC-type Fe3+ transport system substrate-binding protein